MILAKDEWHLVPANRRQVLKVGDLKLFECPLSCITLQTWSILGLVNETTDGDGNILHLPLAGAYLDQPEWYRVAVRIRRTEIAEHRRKALEKGNTK